jgi:hypothetical protein
MVRIIGLRPARIISSERIGWPPAKCRVSWAMTPRSWLGFSVCRIRPVLRPICRPWVAKAFSDLVADDQDLDVARVQPAAV